MSVDLRTWGVVTITSSSSAFIMSSSSPLLSELSEVKTEDEWDGRVLKGLSKELPGQPLRVLGRGESSIMETLEGRRDGRPL